MLTNDTPYTVVSLSIDADGTVRNPEDAGNPEEMTFDQLQAWLVRTTGHVNWSQHPDGRITKVVPCMAGRTLFICATPKQEEG